MGWSRSPQTDGGYLGSDFETFFSAVVSGAAGIYVGMLVEDAGITTDLVVRPGQDVSVSGDRSLAEAPLWGGGGFTVQQRGSLSLASVALGASAALAVTGGGALSLSDMVVPAAVANSLVAQMESTGSSVRLSGVTALEYPALGAVSGTVTAHGDGDASFLTYDPPAIREWFFGVSAFFAGSPSPALSLR